MADKDKSSDQKPGAKKKGGAGLAAAAGAAAGVAAAAGAAAAGGLLTDDKPDGVASVAPAGSPSGAESQLRVAESSDAGGSQGQTQTATREADGVDDATAIGSSVDSPASRGDDGSSIGDAGDPSLAAGFFNGGDRSFSTAATSSPSLADFVENAIDKTDAIVRPVADEFGRIVDDEAVALEDTAQRFVKQTETKLSEFDDVTMVNEGGARANFGPNGADVGADGELGFDSAFVDAGAKADTDLVVTTDRVNVGADVELGFDAPIVGGNHSRFGARVVGDEDGGSARLGAGFEMLGTGLGGDGRLSLDTADGAHVVSTEFGGEAHLGVIPGVVEVGVDAGSTAVVGQQADGDYVAQVGLGTGLDIGVPGGPKLETRLGVEGGGEVGADGGSVHAGADVAIVHVGASAYAEDGHFGASFEIGAINGEPVVLEVTDEDVGDFVEDVQEFAGDVVEGAQELAEDAEEAVDDFVEDPVGFVGGLFGQP